MLRWGQKNECERNKNALASLMLCAPLALGACTFVSLEEMEQISNVNPNSAMCVARHRNSEYINKIKRGYDMGPNEFASFQKCLKNANPDVVEKAESRAGDDSSSWFALFLFALTGMGAGSTGGTGGT